MEEPQNFRIQFPVSEEEIRLVWTLFEQSRWKLTEADLGPSPEGEDRQTWTLLVTEEQRDSINFMVEGDVITLHEEEINDQGAVANNEPPQRWKFRVFRLTDDEDQQLLQLLEEKNWQLENFLGRPEQINQERADEGEEYPEVNVPRFILVPPRGEMQECPDCFAKPCVTHPSNQQGWWPVVAALPSPRNNLLRKNLYYKFWNMCYIRGLWADERYIQKKEEVHGEVNIRREIMPDCVCKSVRYWYPNPPNVPYMGHKVR
jgi:hypothetical protein